MFVTGGGDDDGAVTGVDSLMLVQLVVAGVGLLVIALFFKR